MLIYEDTCNWCRSNIANTLSKGKNTIVVALDDLSLGTPSNLSRSVKFVSRSVMDYDLTLDLGKGCKKLVVSNTIQEKGST